MSKDIILNGQTHSGVSEVEVPVNGGTALFKDEDEIPAAPSGTKQINANGTGIDVAAYEKVDVQVPTGGGLPALTNPASATDILSGKEALDGDGVKIVGTCTFDADTKDANAVASDIAKDKTAYVNGQKVVGTHEGGETVYYCEYSGIPYLADMELTCNTNKYAKPANIFKGAKSLNSLIYHGITGDNDGVLGRGIVSDTHSVKRIEFPDYIGTSNTSGVIANCGGLEEVILGKVGTAVTKLPATFFSGGGGGLASPTLTIYVAAETLADVPTTGLSDNAPFGFGANTVVVYRSSTTGEVLT